MEAPIASATHLLENTRPPQIETPEEIASLSGLANGHDTVTHSYTSLRTPTLYSNISMRFLGGKFNGSGFRSSYSSV